MKDQKKIDAINAAVASGVMTQEAANEAIEKLPVLGKRVSKLALVAGGGAGLVNEKEIAVTAGSIFAVVNATKADDSGQYPTIALFHADGKPYDFADLGYGLPTSYRATAKKFANEAPSVLTEAQCDALTFTIGAKAENADLTIVKDSWFILPAGKFVGGKFLPTQKQA